MKLIKGNLSNNVYNFTYKMTGYVGMVAGLSCVKNPYLELHCHTEIHLNEMKTKVIFFNFSSGSVQRTRVQSSTSQLSANHLQDEGNLVAFLCFSPIIYIWDLRLYLLLFRETASSYTVTLIWDCIMFCLGKTASCCICDLRLYPLLFRENSLLLLSQIWDCILFCLGKTASSYLRSEIVSSSV